MGKSKIEERNEWRWWVTPKPLLDKPIHNWLIFPHSFTSELVHALIDEWELGPNDLILDPFVGAGTTLLAAKEKGIPARGYDLSPFAEFTAQTKVVNYDINRLETTWRVLRKVLQTQRWNGLSRDYPQLVKKALPGKLLSAFDSFSNAINELSNSQTEQNFFQLALLANVPIFSRAEVTGGWLKWVEKKNGVSIFPQVVERRVDRMIQDLREVRMQRKSAWKVGVADARALPNQQATYTSLITSPPYPNRHDYTRVFGVELMLSFLDWEETRKLRYQSFHSHPESHPERPKAEEYVAPRALKKALVRIQKNPHDARVLRMLEGYFLDMYLCLCEAKRVCKQGANIAFVVGNAQYYGQPILVDEITANLGEQVGLNCEKLIIVRYRGNSAQQMGKYGRRPSRETIVVFKKP
jgi:site-specific DNA-methyltransferase (cytosine-N4-specific)